MSYFKWFCGFVLKMVSHKLASGCGIQHRQDMQVDWTMIVAGRLIGPAAINTKIYSWVQSNHFFFFWALFDHYFLGETKASITLAKMSDF